MWHWGIAIYREYWWKIRWHIAGSRNPSAWKRQEPTGVVYGEHRGRTGVSYADHTGSLVVPFVYSSFAADSFRHHTGSSGAESTGCDRIREAKISGSGSRDIGTGTEFELEALRAYGDIVK